MVSDEAVVDAVNSARASLALARREVRSGSLEASWQATKAAATIARTLGDGELLAEAATVMSEPSIAWRSVGERQALCLEALGMLGPAMSDGDESPSRKRWRERVRVQLESLSSGWAESTTPSSDDISALEAEERFALLQSSYLASIGPSGLANRLALSMDAIRLGVAAGDDHFLAWGWHWRADALEQLGLRAEFDHAIGTLFAIIDRLDSPAWTWRALAIRANVALLEDDLEEVPRIAAAAVAAGREAGVEEVELCDLILRSSLAQRTGIGISAIEDDVRAVIVDAPSFAQTWRADLLLSLGRVDEARQIFHAVTPHLDDIPPQVHEWLIGHISLAYLAIAADDRAVAEVLLARLQPLAHLHAASPATTPYRGPVALPLAHLSAFLGDTSAAAEYAVDAVARAEAMRAPHFSASARLLMRGDDHGLPPLSPREAEVARLVSQARTNREIASTLYISERTVEQHVRSILHKLGLPNRAAIVAWVLAER